MTTSSCPSIEQLTLLASGGLSRQDAETAFEHIESCSVCAERLVQIPEDYPLLKSFVSACQRVPVAADDRDSIQRLIARLRLLPRLSVQHSPLQTDFDAQVVQTSDWPHGNSAFDSLEDSLDTVTETIQAYLNPAESSSELGRLGHYKIVQILGVGGMGIVLEAIDLKLERKVAIKVMQPKLRLQNLSQSRFLREARAVAALEHDHIVPIYQVDEENGLPYFVMPLLKGESLDKRLRRQPRLTVNEVFSIAAQTVMGLSVAHAQNLVHRDIKPANIWLEERVSENTKPATSTVRVKLLDFGLVQVAPVDEQSSCESSIAGTPTFMSPEQAVGDEADARSDLFSFGCVLYLLCTGRLPFYGPNRLTQLLSIIDGQPASIRGLNQSVPRELEELVMQLLQKNPADRPVSADAVLEQLQAIHSSSPNSAVAKLRATIYRMGSRPWLGFSVLITALVATILFAISGPSRQRSKVDFDSESRASSDVHSIAKPNTEAVRTLPGLVATPRKRDGYRRWQIETKMPRGEVFAVAWDGSGENIACGSVQGSVRLLSVKSSELVQIIPAHFGTVWAIDWSAESRQLVTGGEDGKVRLFKSDGTLIRNLGSHSGLVRSLAISGDGTFVASGGSDNLIRLWRTDGGTGSTLNGHHSQVDSVAWHPSSKTLASAAWDGTIRIWDIESGVSKEIRLGTTSIQALAWSPSGDRLVAGGVDGSIRFFNQSGDEVAVSNEGSSSITTVAWNPGTALVTGDQNGRVRFWESENEVRRTVDFGPVRINCLKWSNDGKRLAVVSDQVRFLNPDGEIVGALDRATEPLRSIDWNGADQIATVGDDGFIRIWSNDGSQSHQIAIAMKHVSVRWNEHDDKLAAAGWGQTVEIFDQRGNCLVRFPGHDPVAWNPQGDKIAWVSDKNVQLGSLAEVKQTLQGHSMIVQGLGWNADGSLIASGDASGEIRIWKSDGTEVARMKADASASLTWNPKDNILASAGFGNGNIQLWSENGELRTKWKAQVKGILALAWSPDGESLLSTSYDASALRLWKLNGAPDGVLSGSMSVATSACWSRNGDRIASAHLDGTLRCWDSRSLEPLWTTQVFRDGSWSRFDANGTIASSNDSVADQKLVVVMEDENGTFHTAIPSKWFSAEVAYMETQRLNQGDKHTQ